MARKVFNPITPPFDLVSDSISDITGLQTELNGKVAKAGDTMTGNLNMGTNKLIGGTGVTSVLKLQGTTGNGTATSAAIQMLVGNNGGTTALTVLNNGNVGLGVTAPATLFEANGIIRADRVGVPAQYLQMNGGDGSGGVLQMAGSAKNLYIDNLDTAGLYTTNSIVFRNGTSGTQERMRIDGAGRVGIGNTSPGAQLQVNATAATTIGAIIRGAASQTADLLQIQNSAGTSLVNVTAGGNVGIGTTTPSTKLSIASGSVNSNLVGGSDKISVHSDGSFLRLVSSGDGAGANNYAGLTMMRTGGTNAFPTTPLLNQYVSGIISNAYDGTAGGGGTAGIFFIADANVSAGVAPQRISILTSETNNLNRIERLTIKPNGNIGIGTTSPNAQLQVNASSASTVGQIIRGASSQTADLLQIQNSSGTELFDVRANGDLDLKDVNIISGTITGTKIGTATSQKISFWNATPIVQPTTAIAESAFVENAGGVAVNDDSTFDGYTIRQVVKALRDAGLLA